ncbi:MAG: hypothetical protein QM758_08775 [Armatimonas sp.]
MSILVFHWARHIAWINREADLAESNLQKPVTTPLLLGEGQTTHLSFVADGDSEFTITLIFEKTIDFGELMAILNKIEKDKDFEVYVEEEGKSLIADGYSGTGGGQDVMDLTLTSFKVYGGKCYEVTITSKKAYPELAITEPQAEAAIAFWTLKQIAIDHRGFVKFAYFFF